MHKTFPTSPSDVSRRTIVKGAAWSIPVIASAVTIPAAQASTEKCPAVRPHTASYVHWTIENTGTNGEWRRTSTLHVAFTLGWAGGDRGALSYSATGAGIPITTGSYAGSVTMPFRVDWNAPTSAWTIEESISGNQYTYTFRRVAAIPTVIALTPYGTRPSAMSPENALQASEEFTGFAVDSTLPWAIDESYYGEYVLPTSRTLSYAPAYSDPSCDSSMRPYSSAGSLTLTFPTADAARSAARRSAGTSSTASGADDQP